MNEFSTSTTGTEANIKLAPPQIEKMGTRLRLAKAIPLGLTLVQSKLITLKYLYMAPRHSFCT